MKDLLTAEMASRIFDRIGSLPTAEFCALTAIATGRAQVVRWVPATERMPTEQREYFILIERSYEGKMMGAARWVGKDWTLLGVNITHWLEGLRLP